jgi:hypothetical protein
VVEREQGVKALQSALDVARRENCNRVAARRHRILERANARLAEREVAVFETQPEPRPFETRYQYLLDPRAVDRIIAAVVHEGVIGERVGSTGRRGHRVLAAVRGFGRAEQDRARRTELAREMAKLDRRRAC